MIDRGNDSGFTLVEALAATLVASLLSIMVLTGVKFGTEQYVESLLHSESQTLASTITSVIQSELAYTKNIVENEDGSISYQSNHHAVAEGLSSFVVVDEYEDVIDDGYGYLYLGNTYLNVNNYEVLNAIPALPKKSYTKGLGIKINSLAYSDYIFRVDFSIGTGSREFVRRNFEVINVNRVEETTNDS